MPGILSGKPKAVVKASQPCPTKRAPDAGESAQISGSFLRCIIFLAGRLRRPRLSAGNAIRWAFTFVTEVYYVE